ncbi:hypothetical protein ACFQ0T_30380 [Kitasatospora gansuensis]
MSAAALLGLWAVLIAVALPPLLAGARWTRRAPLLGVFTWLALGLSAVSSVALTVRQLIDPAPHHHAGLLHLCGLSPEAVSGTAPAAAALVLLYPAAGCCAAWAAPTAVAVGTAPCSTWPPTAAGCPAPCCWTTRRPPSTACPAGTPGSWSAGARWPPSPRRSWPPRWRTNGRT